MKIGFSGLFLASVLFISGCFDSGSGSDKTANKEDIVFALSCDYAPFTYIDNGEPSGFEVELAKLIALELKKDAKFMDMQFSLIPAAVKSGKVDAGISCIIRTNEREDGFDYTDSYYDEEIGLLYRKATEANVKTNVMETLSGTKIGVQLGTSMENAVDLAIQSGAITDSEKVSMDLGNQLVEALRSGHVDFVVIDLPQAELFAKSGDDLQFSVADGLIKDKDGYRIILPTSSPYKEKFNVAIAKLKRSGKIDELIADAKLKFGLVNMADVKINTMDIKADVAPSSEAITDSETEYSTSNDAGPTLNDRFATNANPDVVGAAPCNNGTRDVSSDSEISGDNCDTNTESEKP